MWSKNLSFNFPNLFFLSNFWSSKIAHNITWNNFYMTLVKLNRYIQHWQKKKSLINYLQKIADKGNCIYNLGICIMHIVFIVVDNQVDLSIKPQLVNRLHGLPINKKTRHYLSTNILYIWVISDLVYIRNILLQQKPTYLILKKNIKAWIECGNFFIAMLMQIDKTGNYTKGVPR